MLTSDPGFAIALQLRVRVRARAHLSFTQLAEHIDFCSDKCHKCSENVQCPTVISSSELLLYTVFL